MVIITKPQVKIAEMDTLERAKFLEISDATYEELRNDFSVATHFKAIDELNLKKINGVYIQAMSEVDGLVAAIYCYKKYAFDNMMGAGKHEDEFDLEDYELDDEFNFYEHQSFEDDTFFYLPIIHLMDTYYDSNTFQGGIGGGPYLHQLQVKREDWKPYWESLDNPLIIKLNGTNFESIKEMVQEKKRFTIVIEVLSDKASYAFFTDDEEIFDTEEVVLSQSEKDFIFETDFEFIKIAKPPMHYLVEMLQSLMEASQYKLAPEVKCEEIIDQLMGYRGRKFESVYDLERIIQKASRYAKNEMIDENAFKQFFNKGKVTLKEDDLKGKALKDFNKLVGLTDVKQQLLRIIDRMKLAEMRKQSGYTNIEHHMAAVFMGNPGTAKTTMARIFGQILFDANVLANNVFVEVSRKDLIGQYVGWTSHKVQEVFDKGKGGTIFIDEAYSLMTKTDNFSDEAFAAIIQNMEDNPDTLVIFAGYTNEMLDFIRNANTGLRSRLTNIVTFDDYSSTELLEIFHYHVAAASYELEDKERINQMILKLIRKLQRFDQRQLGNGRLMRKLLSMAVGYMAQRKPENINLLLIKDMEFACKELFEAESIIQSSSYERKVGFTI